MSLHPESHRSRATRTLAVGVALLAVFALAACAAQPTPSPSASASSASPTPSDSPSPATPSAPVLVPDGTAEENLPLFTAVTAAVWATPENVSGRAYIDALVAAGFDKTTMQVTEDLSTVGNAAESIQFSVLWKGQCLVGQVGPATGAPVTVVLPVIGDTTCLVGATRVIDW